MELWLAALITFEIIIDALIIIGFMYEPQLILSEDRIIEKIKRRFAKWAR